MKTRLFLAAVVALLASPVLAQAQADTVHHRAVYSAINKQEKSLTKVAATYKDDPLTFALTGWLDGPQVRKIVARADEDGDSVSEYYLENEKPVFVFTTYYRNHLSKSPVRVEERMYFKDGRIFKWISTDKPVAPLHGEDYTSQTEVLNSNCAAFVKALKSHAKDGKR